MPKSDPLQPASDRSATMNTIRILSEGGTKPIDADELTRALNLTSDLRGTLTGKGLKGFKKGGKVKKTGPAILHKGEKVIPAKKASPKKTASKPKPAPALAFARVNRGMQSRRPAPALRKTAKRRR